ncbi:MAG: acyl-CoA-binding protein [Cyclobacteriaceae bacterium]|nr:acyl-CoA-binding protein [Cyclobacteriaceae bacterium]
MNLNENFLKAAERVHTLPQKPSNENLLKMYGLYKQATEGDVQGEQPGGFDFKGLAKYNSWASLRGTSKETAMQQYIELVESLF